MNKVILKPNKVDGIVKAGMLFFDNQTENILIMICISYGDLRLCSLVNGNRYNDTNYWGFNVSDVMSDVDLKHLGYGNIDVSVMDTELKQECIL